MAKKLLSIYVGNNVTRICEVSRNGKIVNLHNAVEMETPKGAVDDGMITDVPAMAEAIRKCIYGRGLSYNKIIFTISSKKIATKEINIPYLNNSKKVDELVRANATEYFPMSNIGDYVYAQTTLEVLTAEGGGKECRALAIAAPREMVLTYYDLARNLKIPIEKIDYVGNSIIQLLQLQMTDGTSMVLQIEKDATFVSVMRGKTLILQRSVPYGKNAVTRNLMELKRISEKEATLLLQDENRLHALVTTAEYSDAIRLLVSGIARVVEYHMSRNRELPIEAIKIFGEGCAIAGIEEALQRELGMPVARFPKFQGIALAKSAVLTQEDVLKYLTCISGAINPVNLYVAGATEKKKIGGSTGVSNKLLLALMGVAAVISVGNIVATAFSYSHTVSEKKKLEVKVKSIESIELIEKTYEQAEADFNKVDNFYKSTETANENIHRFVLDLESVMPTNIAITDLSIADGEVNIKAIGTEKEELAEFLVQLKELEYTKEVFIDNLAEVKTEDEEISEVSFSLTLRLFTPEEERMMQEAEALAEGEASETEGGEAE